MIISTRKFGIATQRYLLSEEALLCARTHPCAQKLTLESKKKTCIYFVLCSLICIFAKRNLKNI